MANLRSMVYNSNTKLNDSEKQIIQYVLNNPNDCSKLSLAKLAKKLYVSESAIFRLCKKLGLSGYSELKFDLVELAESNQKPIKIENGIRVYIDSEDFHIDEISIDDFKTENDRNDFIEMISDEIGIMESLVDELTETINKKILERLKH